MIRTLAPWPMIAAGTELFQGELLAAMRIVQRGDLTLRDLIGAYAGKSARPSFCHRPTSNTASITMATAMSICDTARQMCLPRRPIS